MAAHCAPKSAGKKNPAWAGYWSLACLLWRSNCSDSCPICGASACGALLCSEISSRSACVFFLPGLQAVSFQIYKQRPCQSPKKRVRCDILYLRRGSTERKGAVCEALPAHDMTERLFGWCDAVGGVKIIDTI